MRAFLSAIILLSAPLCFAENAHECVVRVKRQQIDPQIQKKMMEKCFSVRIASGQITRQDCLKAASEFPGKSGADKKDICLEKVKYQTASQCVSDLANKTPEVKLPEEKLTEYRSTLMRRCILDRMEIMSREDCIEAAAKFPTDQEKIAQNKLCQDNFSGFIRVNGINVRPKKGKQ